MLIRSFTAKYFDLIGAGEAPTPAPTAKTNRPPSLNATPPTFLCVMVEVRELSYGWFSGSRGRNFFRSDTSGFFFYEAGGGGSQQAHARLAVSVPGVNTLHSEPMCHG